MTLRRIDFGKLALMASFLLISANVFAQNETRSQKPKVITYSETENIKELYVAVMGEVSKPGTYHLDSSSLNLHSVIDRARGFTPDASKVIRVIRQGRVSQKEIFSETVNSPLFSGDLLIVDPKPSNGFTSRVQEFATEPNMINASYQEQAQPPVIQIGLLNVLDYPVVVKIRPENASAMQIIENLQQPVQLIADADVIVPGRRVTSDVAKQLPRLADGSVIVFKKKSIDRSHLPPTLPRPIESEIALGAQSGLIGNAYGQSPELRSLGQRLSSVGQDPYDSSARFSSRLNGDLTRPANSSPEIPAGDLRSELSPPPINGNPRIATIPFSGSPQFKNSSTSRPYMDDAKSGSIPMPDDPVAESPPSTLENDPLDPAEELAVSAPATFSLRQILIVFFIVGSSIGSAILLRRFLEANSRPTFTAPANNELQQVTENPAVAIPASFAAKPLLDRLIRNELPVKYEQVEFPQGLLLQGRIAPRPILRVDGPQSILKQQGPHFPSHDHSEETSPEIIAQVDQPEASLIRRPHFFDAENRKAAVESKPTRSEAGTGVGFAKAPLASALFDLEQGGRS